MNDTQKSPLIPSWIGRKRMPAHTAVPNRVKIQKMFSENILFFLIMGNIFQLELFDAFRGYNVLPN